MCAAGQVWAHRPIAFDFDTARLKLSKQDLQARMVAELNNHYSNTGGDVAETADAAPVAAGVAPPPPGSASVSSVTGVYTSGVVAPELPPRHPPAAAPAHQPSPEQTGDGGCVGGGHCRVGHDVRRRGCPVYILF